MKRVNHFMQLIGWGVTLGVTLGVTVFLGQIHVTDYVNASVTYTATTTADAVDSPRIVQVVAHIEWTPERIEEEIRTVFHEDPNTAVAIAKCESGLKVVIQSHHILSYGREQSFGIMQIHKPDWHTTALRLGYDQYQTDVQDNLAMARFIYENRGFTFKDWSCFNSGAYKRYL